MLNALFIAVAAVQAAQAPPNDARTPSWSDGGRIAFAASGDLWVRDDTSGSAPARRITRGPSWDRDPAWAGRGELLFSSDRAGGLDIWRVRLAPDGAWSEPERVTRDADAETEPAVLPDGSIVFVRGREDATDLWRLYADGREARLTDEPGDDVAPTVSAEGDRLAWLAERSAGTEIRVLTLASGEVRRIEAAGAIDLAWSPDGRLTWVARGADRGTWLMGADGSDRQRLSDAVGTIAWSADGTHLALGAEPQADVGYNGDPDRIADREATDGPAAAARLRVLSLPAGDAPAELVMALASPGPADYAAELDRVWDRVDRLYAPRLGSGTDAAAWTRAWQAARERHRPAPSAASGPQLEGAIHAMLRDRPPARAPASGRTAVSSANQAATAAGVEILEAGGNVVDAAVAVSFAIGVVEPDASGIGGYGEMLIHLAGMAEPIAIEFMTRHPEAIGELAPGERLDGPRRVNVPGTVAGMELAWKAYGSGRVSWARVIEPAIRLAERGYVVSDGLATTLRREWLEFAKHEGSRALFFPAGQPLAEGDTLRNPDLARTLGQIAEGGADAFYRGEIAKRIVADLGAAGNPLGESDFARYVAAERRPVRTTYRGHAVYSGPPPVTGGVGLTAKLNLLEQAEPGTSMTDDASALHALIEAWKLQPSTFNRIADPDQWPVDVTPFESKDTARARWRCFDPSRAATSAGIQRGCVDSSGGAAGPRSADDGAFAPASGDPHAGDVCDADVAGRCRSTGTTAFAIADVDGNAVSVTQTLGTWGGNFYVTPGLGFLYNDKATGLRGNPDAYGSARPFGRVGTVIAPTLVYDGVGEDKKPLLAVGAAGNAWITAAVYTAVVGVLDYGLGPQEALELPRMLVGGGGGFGGPNLTGDRSGPGQAREALIQIEDGFSPDAIRRLEAMGHRFRRISLPGELRMGYGAAVLVRDGVATAGADPRRAGAAGAVR